MCSEIILWKAYLQCEPHGERRNDWHAAQISHAIYTFMSGFSKSKTEIKLEDNLLKFESPFDKKEIDPNEATLKNIMTLTKIFNTKDKKVMPNLIAKIKEIDNKDKDKVKQE